MHRPAPPVHGKVAAAVTVSVLVHALIGLGWWATADRQAVAAPGPDTTVPGPNDTETVFVLRDAPAERPRPSSQPVPRTTATSPPATLPASVTGAGPKPPDGGAPAQSGISQAGHDSLPKSTGSKPLHGPLPAGKSVVYVLDRSASMGAQGILARAVAAIQASLEQLGPDVRFGLVAYAGRASAFSPGLAAATPENVARAVTWLAQFQAEGGSNHAAGVQEGLWLHPDAMVLLTDADDFDEAEVRRLARLMRTPGQLRVAIFGGRPATRETPLERFVRDRGGAIQYVER